MYREYKEEKYLGLFLREIAENKVKTVEKLHHGDTVKNSKGLILWYTGSGFRLWTNDPKHYIIEEDLIEEFKL